MIAVLDFAISIRSFAQTLSIRYIHYNITAPNPTKTTVPNPIHTPLPTATLLSGPVYPPLPFPLGLGLVCTGLGGGNVVVGVPVRFCTLIQFDASTFSLRPASLKKLRTSNPTLLFASPEYCSGMLNPAGCGRRTKE